MAIRSCANVELSKPPLSSLCMDFVLGAVDGRVSPRPRPCRLSHAHLSLLWRKSHLAHGLARSLDGTVHLAPRLVPTERAAAPV